MKRLLLAALCALLIAAAVGCAAKQEEKDERIVGKWYSFDPQTMMLSTPVVFEWNFKKDGTFTCSGMSDGTWEHGEGDEFSFIFYGMADEVFKGVLSNGVIKITMGSYEYVLKQSKDLL